MVRFDRSREVALGAGNALPAERRNVDTDFEHLAGRLRCVVRERGKVVFAGTSELAGLEVGSLPDRD